jgi:membrane-bound lytic murein transglycosylase B
LAATQISVGHELLDFKSDFSGSNEERGRGLFEHEEDFIGVSVVLVLSPTREIPEAWKSLAARLVADGLDPEYVADIFCHLGDTYFTVPMGTKVLELYRIKMNRGRPRTPTPPKEPDAAALARGALPGIHPGVLTAGNMYKSRKFLAEHADELAIMHERFGVEPEMAVAILLVETGLGTFLGRDSALKSLAGMAASRDPEKMRPYLKDYIFDDSTLAWLEDLMPRRADWAYRELKALLAYGHNHEMDIFDMPGSVYGAVGLCQFMPSNIDAYGVDATGKGWIDLFTVTDALHSLANYLKEHGWSEDLSRPAKHAVLMRYNNSTRYANTLITVADYLKTPPGTPLPTVAFNKDTYK